MTGFAMPPVCESVYQYYFLFSVKETVKRARSYLLRARLSTRYTA
jgi:hypothetical protein